MGVEIGEMCDQLVEIEEHLEDGDFEEVLAVTAELTTIQERIWQLHLRVVP